MRRARVLLASFLLLGCRSAPPPSPAPDDARTRGLEARIAALEARLVPVTLDDEILALEVQRAAALVTYARDHPAVADLERKIEALGKVRALAARARREAMARRLEAEREVLLAKCTPDHPTVRKLDAKLAFLRSDAG